MEYGLVVIQGNALLYAKLDKIQYQAYSGALRHSRLIQISNLNEPSGLSLYFQCNSHWDGDNLVVNAVCPKKKFKQIVTRKYEGEQTIIVSSLGPSFIGIGL
jgi:hypothetical protein